MSRPEVKTLADIRDTAKAITEWCLAQPDLTGWSIRLLLPPEPILVVGLDWDDRTIKHTLLPDEARSLSHADVTFELEQMAEQPRRHIASKRGPQR